MVKPSNDEGTLAKAKQFLNYSCSHPQGDRGVPERPPSIGFDRSINPILSMLAKAIFLNSVS